MCAESGSTSEQRSCVPGVQNTRPLETLRDEPRQVAAVIEVGVREDDCVDGRGGDGQRLPVAIAAVP